MGIGNKLMNPKLIEISAMRKTKLSRPNVAA
jgi:hypothetical protein